MKPTIGYDAAQDAQISSPVSISPSRSLLTEVVSVPRHAGQHRRSSSFAFIDSRLERRPVLAAPELEHRQREDAMRVGEALLLPGNERGNGFPVEQRGVGLAQHITH